MDHIFIKLQFRHYHCLVCSILQRKFVLETGPTYKVQLKRFTKERKRTDKLRKEKNNLVISKLSKGKDCAKNPRRKTKNIESKSEGSKTGVE